jgi:glycosyltransferase involved in cell wall biosynthesis
VSVWFTVPSSTGVTERPLLTVITPCLNAAATIPDTLRSVAAATAALAEHGHQLEHWVIDGGSSDTTMDKVSRHAERFHFCRIKEGVGGGVYRAMNVGLQLATGHFTHILNADDIIIDPNGYRSLVRDGLNRGALILLSSILYFRRPTYMVRHSWDVQPLPADPNSWQRLLKSGLHYPHPGFFAQTDFYRSEGFDERYSLSADYKLMQSLLLRPDLAMRLSVCTSHLVGMAEGGATAGLAAILRGSRQLAAINRELGICDSFWRRYPLKLWRRLQPFRSPALAGRRLLPPDSIQ